MNAWMSGRVNIDMTAMAAAATSQALPSDCCAIRATVEDAFEYLLRVEDWADSLKARKQADRQTDRQTNKQTNKQANKRTSHPSIHASLPPSSWRFPKPRNLLNLSIQIILFGSRSDDG
eukprot:GHVU01078382.1.p1 GENE.GHVU01078382.1~~GHVU01078382.1.p1  ORF type:complete len:119 (-),score=27.54 GHVU01078382.1:758-1114(-)